MKINKTKNKNLAKKLFSKNNSRLRAFSLIELSIVILIIGLLIGGILASNSLIKKFRIQTAQSLTISSPIQGIPDSVLWLESSLDKSFKDSESSDTSSLSAWYDVRESVNKNNATQSNSSYYPTYSNSINSIQAVKFDGTNGYFTVDGSILNNTNYTIFVLEQRDSSKSGNYFIGDSSSSNETTTNKNLVLGYSADGTVKHSQSSDNSYTSSISSYSASSGTPRIFAFVHNSTSGKKTYINGLLAATSTDTNHLSGMTNLTIGKSYQGQLGELVIFARALTDEERQSVEDYLGKKWNSKILRTIGSSAASGGIGGSCVGGTVGTDSCLTPCTVTAAVGITDTTVAGGSGSLNCNTSQNFTGSLPYTCINGQFNYTGATACSCASGYTLSGSSCVTSACTGGTESTATVSGVTYKIHTFNSSGSLSCPSSRTAQVLVVGGGGSGGSANPNAGGGGGGGGGVVYSASYPIDATTYSVTVGAGGAGVAAIAAPIGIPGNNGGDSVFGTMTAKGGGGGGALYNNYNGRSGGSGGGGSWVGGAGGSSNQTAQTNETAHYGNAGGNDTTQACGAGGGGAGATASGTGNCIGGDGILIQITGSDVYYGAGGGGSGGNPPGSLPGASGGTGGGGAGGKGAPNTTAGGNGTANTGSGGGASTSISSRISYSGNGGSGIVIVRYAQ